MTKKPHPIDAIIGENLRRIRTHSGLSQTELGRRLGVSFQQIQKYENAANRIAASRLWECARALNAPIESFFLRHSGDSEIDGKEALHARVMSSPD